MTLSKTGITCLLVAAFVTPATVPLSAQPSCAQVVEKMHARTTALNTQAQINNANMLRDEVVGPALGEAQRTLESRGEVSLAAYNQIQDAVQKAQAWIDRLNAFDTFFTRLKQCGETGCNMFKFIEDEKARARFAESVQQKLNDWVQSLGDSGVTAAAERVNKVSGIVRETASSAQEIGMEGATGAVNCMSQFVRTPPTASGDPVNLGGAPAAPASSGPSIGKILGYTALFTGALIGGAYAAMPAEETGYLSSPAPTTSNQSTSPPASSTANYRFGNWNCGGPQCTQVYGGNSTGSVGPFCTPEACAAWARADGARSCSAQRQFALFTGPPAGRPCSDQ